MKKCLPDVTLIALSSTKIGETLCVIENCCELIDFAEVKLVTHKMPENVPNMVKIELCPILDHIDKYNEYCFLNLGKHVNTSHCLVVQHDSGIINAELWCDDWLDLDWIGAPWPIKNDAYIAWGSGEHVRVGNGGFSLRSKKIMDAPRKLGLKLEQEMGWANEDGNYCVYHRSSLLKYGIRYAPVEIASEFSYENPVPENNFGQMKTFGWHKNYPYWSEIPWI